MGSGVTTGRRGIDESTPRRPQHSTLPALHCITAFSVPHHLRRRWLSPTPLSPSGMARRCSQSGRQQSDGPLAFQPPSPSQSLAMTPCTLHYATHPHHHHVIITRTLIYSHITGRDSRDISAAMEARGQCPVPRCEVTEVGDMAHAAPPPSLTSSSQE